MHRIVYLPVKNGKFCQYFTYENILRLSLSLINPAVYLLNKICVCLAASVMQKGDFSPGKRMKGICVHVLEFSLTLA